MIEPKTKRMIKETTKGKQMKEREEERNTQKKEQMKERKYNERMLTRIIGNKIVWLGFMAYQLLSVI